MKAPTNLKDIALNFKLCKPDGIKDLIKLCLIKLDSYMNHTLNPHAFPAFRISATAQNYQIFKGIYDI